MARKNVKILRRITSLKSEKERGVFQVVIPKKIMEELKWEEGVELEPKVIENILIFKKIKKKG